MKKPLSKAFILGFMILFLYACTQQNSPQKPDQPKNMNPNQPSSTAEINKDFNLSPGQQINISGTDIDIYFLDVENDSRCPSDSDCYDAGTTNIVVKILKKSDSSNKSALHLALGGQAEIDDEYYLNFTKIAPERGKQSEEIRKTDYRATFRLDFKHKPLPVPVMELQNPSGAVFPKESLPPHNSKQFEGVGIQTIGLWNPSLVEAQKADQIVANCIFNKEKTVEQRVKDYAPDEREKEKKFDLDILQKIEPIYSNYIRQYIGYTGKDGHQLIWINFFLPQDAKGWDWKKEIFQPPMTAVRSAYHGFFNTLVDLNDKNCLYFGLGT